MARAPPPGSLQQRIDSFAAKITNNRFVWGTAVGKLGDSTEARVLCAGSEEWERRNEAVQELAMFFGKQNPESLSFAVLRELKLPLQVCHSADR